jgi:hypothetical protein
MKVLYVHERLLESWGKDLFTFGCLFSGWYLNHRFTGGAWAIDFTIAFMVILGGACNVIVKRYKSQEAVDVLQELVRQDIKESRESSHDSTMVPCSCETLYVNSPVGIAVFKIDPICKQHGIR